jgi:hypothetical protein
MGSNPDRPGEKTATNRVGHVTTTKTALPWDVRQCNLIEVLRRFGGIPCIHLQSQQLNQAGLLFAGFLLGLLFDLEEGGRNHADRVTAACRRS